MSENKMIQKAGDGSQQVQAETVIIQNGISEERCRAIYSELSEKALADQTLEALAVANKKVQEFEERLLPRIQSLESNYSSFASPSFQLLIKKAQVTAACSDRELDYGLLTELIAHRINNKGNIKKKASIEKAVEIVDKIDDDALCGLTMFHAMNRYVPVSGNISEGLQAIDQLYSKCQYAELPSGQDWLDNLEILGAIRINQIGSLKKFEDYLCDSWEGYVCVGIKNDSQDYIDCCQLLQSVGLNVNSLINNELLDGYVRLPLMEKSSIEKLSLSVAISTSDSLLPIIQRVPLTQEQKKVLNQIYDKYSKEPIVEKVKKNFKEKIYSLGGINTACQWWNSIKSAFSITSIGSAIAQANAKRVDNTLPDID